jgi:hypothetical protein
MRDRTRGRRPPGAVPRLRHAACSDVVPRNETHERAPGQRAEGRGRRGGAVTNSVQTESGFCRVSRQHRRAARRYQMTMRSVPSRAMGSPALQPNARAKASMFDGVPTARNIDGAWGSVTRRTATSSGV